MTRIIQALSEISHEYDALFCDLWGCVHDGIHAFEEAVSALRAYRAKGGIVILVTNSPRPWREVEQQLDQLGVSREAWDAIATSGDSARAAMFLGAVGSRIYAMGEDHDRGFYEPLSLIEHPVDLQIVDRIEQAEGIVCTGPAEPLKPPEQHKAELMLAKQAGLKLLCANPDIIVDRGEAREYCAGAVAELYTELGGESLYFGKPYPPIYDLARRRLATIDARIRDDRILAIGDGIATDVSGGIGEGLSTLFISGGLARAETKTVDQPEEKALLAYLAEKQLSPEFTIGFLR